MLNHHHKGAMPNRLLPEDRANEPGNPLSLKSFARIMCVSKQLIDFHFRPRHEPSAMPVAVIATGGVIFNP